MTVNSTDYLSDLEDLYETLREDIDILAKAIAADDGTYRYPDPALLQQTERRHLVRSVAAFVEAMLFQIRQLLLSSPSITEQETSLLLALAEKQIEVTEAGYVREKNMKIATLTSLKFTLRTFDAVFKTNKFPDFSGKNYQMLVNTFGVRDRLMHPKMKTSIHITDDEVRDVLVGFVWVNNVLASVLATTAKDLHARLKAAVTGIEAKQGKAMRKRRTSRSKPECS